VNTTNLNEQTAVASMCCRDCGEVLAVDDVPLSELPDFVASAEARGYTFSAGGFVRCSECAHKP